MGIVYRIENSDGSGLFNSEIGKIKPSKFWREFLNTHDEPTAIEDFRWFNKHQFCAYKSMEQIKRLYKQKYINRLLKIGFRFYMIDLKYFEESANQIIFYKTDIVEKIDITEYFIE